MAEIIAGDGCFEGYEPRECGDHRTVGEHRAWCFDCRMWCYPGSPGQDGCYGCRQPVLAAILSL